MSPLLIPCPIALPYLDASSSPSFMHLLHFRPAMLDSIFGLSGGQMIALAVPVSVFLVGGTIAICAMYFHHRRRQMWHETARVALEKGQPIPEASPDQTPWNWKMGPDGGVPPAASARIQATFEQLSGQRTRGYMVGGLVNVAVGSGLYLALSEVSPRTAYFAAIPGFVGVALLLAGLLEALLSRKTRD